MLIKKTYPKKENSKPCNLKEPLNFRKQVLVAEDSIDFSYLMKVEAEKIFNWKFHFVQYGMDALCFCKNFLFDAVILDVTLPDCSGYHVAGELKRANYSSPVLAFTLVEPKTFYSKKESFYFDGVLKKPFDRDDFNYHVNKAIPLMNQPGFEHS